MSLHEQPVFLDGDEYVRLRDRIALLKAGTLSKLLDFEKLNRWPAGAAAGKGGQFAPKNVSGGGAVAMAPEESSGGDSSSSMPKFSDWRIKDDNKNAKTHNNRVSIIESATKNKDVKSILSLSFGTNTYAKKQVKLANEALAALGSKERVSVGQKKNSHSALNGGATTPPAPAPAPAPAPPPKPAPAPAPAPTADAPAPSATSHAYKKAKTLDDAVAQLESFGMKVKRLEAYYQSDWKKKIIAEAPPEKKAHYEKLYGPKKAKGVITDGSFLKLLNAIGPEVARLANEFPPLVQAINLQQRTAGRALGVYGVVSKTISLRPISGQKANKTAAGGVTYYRDSKTGQPVLDKDGNKIPMPPWTYEQGNPNNENPNILKAQDTLRHEAGHALDIGVLNNAILTGLRAAASTMPIPPSPLAIAQGNIKEQTLSGNAALTAYCGNTFSRYGGKSAVESVAEMVSAYTAADYKPGFFPKPFEDVLEKYLRGNGVSKALGDEDEPLPEDFISISIPEPPEGYELISIDGVDIRFRAPDGNIVQYVDMVEQGLFGDWQEDEE